MLEMLKEHKLGYSAEKGKALQLIHKALEGFYAFENDEVENYLDQSLLKFNGEKNWFKKTRMRLWSNDSIRSAIIIEALRVHGQIDR